MLEVEELCGVKADKGKRRESSGKSHAWRREGRKPPKIKAVRRTRATVRALASSLGSECR